MTSDTPRHWRGDMRRIRQVTVNQVGNAIKLTDAAEEAIDLAGLRALAADVGEDNLGDLMHSFLETSRERIDAISAAAEAGDLAVIEGHAHALISSAGTFGASRLSGLARKIEAACLDGDHGTVLRLRDELRKCFAAAETALRPYATDRRA